MTIARRTSKPPMPGSGRDWRIDEMGDALA